MLFRKMCRDMRQNAMQFVSIFLMAFLAIFVYAGIGGEWYGIQQTLNRFHEETNLASYWLYGEGFSTDDLNEIKSLEEVTQAERRIFLEGVGDFENSPTLELYFLDENEISQPQIIEGSDFDINDSDSIWIDYRFAEAKGLKVGDRMGIMIHSMELEKTIAGIVISPEYSYYTNEGDLWPDFNNIGYAFLSVDAFPTRDFLKYTIENGNIDLSEMIEKLDIDADEMAALGISNDMITTEMLLGKVDEISEEDLDSYIPYTNIVIKSNATDEVELEDKISDKIDRNYTLFLTRDSFTGTKMIENEVEQHKAMGRIFPIAFMAIALLALITTMTRLVNTQRTQIGTLKALGFKRGKILRHYLGYGFWLSALGSALGAVAGVLTLPRLFYPSMSEFYNLPEWKPAFSISFAIMAVVSTLICTLMTYLSCNQLLKEKPADTLRAKAPKKMKANRFEKSEAWKKLGFQMQWNIRDVFRSKVRTIMGFVGTASCMGLLICAFSELDTMEYMKSFTYDKVQQYESQLKLDGEITLEDAERIAKDVDGQLLMTSSIEIKANGIKKVGSLTVIENNNLYVLVNSEQDEVELNDGEIALSRRMAQALDVTQGSEITWHPYGVEKWITSEVKILNQIPTGQGITITRNTLENLGYEFQPNTVIVKNVIDDYKDDDVLSVFSKDDMIKTWDKMMEAMNIMIYVLIFAALFLAVVVLHNLGLLSFTERERELATLKVVGFQTRKIRSLLLVQNIWLSVLGSIAGTPFGLWLLKVMLDTSGEDFDFIIHLTPKSFLVSAAVTIIVSFLVNLMFTKKIKKLDMVASLKGVE